MGWRQGWSQGMMDDRPTVASGLQREDSSQEMLGDLQNETPAL